MAHLVKFSVAAGKTSTWRSSARWGCSYCSCCREVVVKGILQTFSKITSNTVGRKYTTIAVQGGMALLSHWRTGGLPGRQRAAVTRVRLLGGCSPGLGLTGGQPAAHSERNWSLGFLFVKGRSPRTKSRKKARGPETKTNRPCSWSRVWEVPQSSALLQCPTALGPQETALEQYAGPPDSRDPPSKGQEIITANCQDALTVTKCSFGPRQVQKAFRREVELRPGAARGPEANRGQSQVVQTVLTLQTSADTW